MGPMIYRDDDNLYLEWPTYALKFPFTEGGLGKALKQIPYHPSLRASPLGTSNLPKAPSLVGHIARKVKVAKGTRHKREVGKFTPEQRSKMMALIRRRESQ